MKRSIQLTLFSRFVLLVFVSLVARLQLGAQTDSSLGFFPLQLNDLWQYRHHFYDCCCNYDISSYFTVSVAGDTVLSDGLTYEVLETNPSYLTHTRYLRVDTATANVYEFSGDTSVGDYLVDSLRATVGSTFRSFGGGTVQCGNVDTATVVGMHTVVKRFAGAGIIHALAYGLGLTQVDTMIFQCGTWDSRSDFLCYARIGRQEYGTFVGVSKTPEIVRGSFTLTQNYPNPFNPTTVISYQLPVVSNVKLVVYDLLGRQVAALVNEVKQPGSYAVQFNGSNLASGVYFYRLQAGNFVQTKKLLLLR